MSMQGKRVLVTGADGFIGSHLVQTLKAAGASVRAFVYYNSFNHWGWLDALSEGMYLEQTHVKVPYDKFHAAQPGLGEDLGF